ncbi:SafA/ExsA family spore coat assembly protein [Virgibacillus kekensis]|uniref:SafA/ExsA family spore coat assembly protein n=1 Tax=Virgibacillus kekensis TaxID=202261 RepID=A0ABV9DJB4_9BACI
MRIHIVQKGDTLWEIAKQYNVDFDQLKEANPQLSSPDMIMPGMKIKIPSTSKPVKKESVKPKETQKPVQQPIQQPAQKPTQKPTQHPYKDTSPKPQPVMKEDDTVKPKQIQPKMPMPQFSKQALFEQEMNQYTTINLPPAPKHEAKPMHHMHKPMVPMCPHCHKPCCPPPMHHGYQHQGYQHHGMHPGYQQGMHHGHPMGPAKKDCGCGGPKPMMYQPQQYAGAGYMESSESSSSMEMPKKPMYSPQMGGYGPQNQPFTGYNPNMPPHFHPNFRYPSGQDVPYPAPPGYPGYSGDDFNTEEDESSGD